ncbi:MAG: LPS export ABC transporter periplasmic protein LptC [Acidobacteriota bacterium]|nr:LPS export ABC transporter periplasmic protein LptC [Blastocatellia bacterium]MDW8413593.1 LPS export ABC transporter periplasmic protein LptC [Acidobacteriota bacterium]
MLAGLLFLGVVLELIFHLVSKVHIDGPSKMTTPVKLSGSLTAVFDSFKYTHHEGGRKRYVLTASRDKVFGDGHHELEDVQLDTFNAEGAMSSTVKALRCRYDQREAQLLFEGEVVLTTPDGVTVKTERVSYDQRTGNAQTAAEVNFSKGRLSGSCKGLVVDTPSKRFEMMSNVRLKVEPGQKQVDSNVTDSGATVFIVGSWAQYEDSAKRVTLRNARIFDNQRSLVTDRLVGYLEDDKLRKLEARGRCFVESSTSTVPTSATSSEMDFYLAPQGYLTKVEARGAVKVTQAEGQLFAERAVLFMRPAAGSSELERIEARRAVKLVYGAESCLTAEQLDAFYLPGGSFLAAATARGEVVATSQLPNQRRIVRTASARISFYQDSNVVRELVAEDGLTIELIDREGLKVSTSKSGRATFNSAGNIELAVQEGSFRYDDGNRRAIADRAIYTAEPEKIVLRGGKVAVWDDNVRTQAEEIELASVESVARGRVRSTYYGSSSAGKTPFRDGKSPVFITANQGYFQNSRVIYLGDVRAWQEDDFISADRLELHREQGKVVAIGRVLSGLFSGSRAIYASSEKMSYIDGERLVEYEGNVKIWQGQESTLQADRVKIFLTSAAEVSKMEAEGQIVVSQPGRVVRGERAEYSASTDTVIITGNSVSAVVDGEGAITARRLTLVGGGDKIFADDERSIKRVRSAHEVRQ